MLQLLSKANARRVKETKLFQFTRGLERYHLCKSSARDPVLTEALLKDLVSGNSKIELTIETNALKAAYQLLKGINQLQARPPERTLAVLRIANPN